MQFNPDKTKQHVQVVFLQTWVKPAHPPLYFNENQAVIKQDQKHFGSIFYAGLTFYSRVREKIISARRGIDDCAKRAASSLGKSLPWSFATLTLLSSNMKSSD